MQAILPVRNGGLGVWRVSSLALSASTTYWFSGRPLMASPVLFLQSSFKQHEWDKPSIAADLACMNTSLPERHHLARLLAVSVPLSGDWLDP